MKCLYFKEEAQQTVSHLALNASLNATKKDQRAPYSRGSAHCLLSLTTLPTGHGPSARLSPRQGLPGFPALARRTPLVPTAHLSPAKASPQAHPVLHHGLGEAPQQQQQHFGALQRVEALLSDLQ